MMRDRGEKIEPLPHATVYLNVDHDSGSDQRRQGVHNLYNSTISFTSVSFVGDVSSSEAIAIIGSEPKR